MSHVTPEMREEEPWRWCIYCDADCDLEDPEHAGDCPQTTGLYPVKEMARCIWCHRPFDPPEPDPESCSECGADFKIGDTYALLHIEDDTYEVVCSGCAVLGEVTM